MNNLFLLFFEFFKVGLFTYGGGYASLPFLYEITENYNWYSSEQLTQFIAIAGLTPGPVGLNMATFAGFHSLGLLGSIISSTALVIPMVIITGIVFKLYEKFKANKYVNTILYVLRPTGCALLCAVGIKLFNNLIVVPKDYLALLLLIILFISSFKLSRNPVIYISISIVFAVIFKILLIKIM